MKRIFCFLVTAFFYGNMLLAQVPNKFNYQAVARNSAGQSIPNAPITVRITILDGGPNAAGVYSETRSVTTNQLGLFTIAIGSSGAIASAGNFANINWSTGNKYIKVDADPLGGSNFVTLGNSELLSVPYALYAVNGVPGVAGPQGPPGAQGVAGPQGVAGTQGVAGPIGPAGPQGATGPQGPQGLPGTGSVNTIQGDAVISVANPSGPTVTVSVNNNSITTNKLAQSGAANGQVLKWNGVQWVAANETAGPWIINGNDIANTNSGNVGIGVNAPSANLHVAQIGNNPTTFVLGRNHTGGGFTSMYMGNSANANGYNYIQSVKTAGTAFGDLALNHQGGNVGIGTTTPATKLHVNGGFTLADGTQGANKILVSNANGQANWQDRNIYFTATVNNQTFSAASTTAYETVYMTAEGTNPYFANNVFTAPSDGYYHFDLHISSLDVVEGFNDDLVNMSVVIRRIDANVNIASFSAFGPDRVPTVTLSTNTFLNAGEKVAVVFRGRDDDNEPLWINSSSLFVEADRFSGFKVF